MDEKAFDEIFGPQPSWWKVVRARFWSWRRHKWFKLLRLTVCKRSGHTPKEFPFFDGPGAAITCTRCQAAIYPYVTHIYDKKEGKWKQR